MEEMKFFIYNTKLFLEQIVSFSNQSKWEFLKYKPCKKCASFSNVLAQKSRKQHADLLCKITTTLEQDIDSKDNFEEFDKNRKRI